MWQYQRDVSMCGAGGQAEQEYVKPRESLKSKGRLLF